MDKVFLNDSELFAAYRLLFSSDSGVAVVDLDSIQPDELKKAYRRRALDTHPDRFSSLGEGYQQLCAERFIRIGYAYELLNKYLAVRDQGFGIKKMQPEAETSIKRKSHVRAKRSKPVNPNHNRATAYSSDLFSRRKELPGRYLRFGEFLYYSRLVSWQGLISALVKQTKLRPRIGEIADKWQWLTELQIRTILMNKYPGERLGDALVREQVLTPFQLRVLLWHQRKLQRPIGRFFVEQGHLSETDLDLYLDRHSKHNLAYGSHFTYPSNC
ncbi:MAG: DnaJ domain-containing protein [Syntrophobacteraceae bacterium]